MATLTKDLRAAIAAGPFAGLDLVPFFGTKKAAERFLADFTEARDYAVKLEKSGSRAVDCTFPEQFWDGTLFLDSDDAYEIGLRRDTQDDFPVKVSVYDEALDADIRLIRYGVRRMIVVDWCWKDDEYAIDAWWLE